MIKVMPSMEMTHKFQMKVGVMAESYTVKRSTQCIQTEVMPMFKTLRMQVVAKSDPVMPAMMWYQGMDIKNHRM